MPQYMAEHVRVNQLGVVARLVSAPLEHPVQAPAVHRAAASQAQPEVRRGGVAVAASRPQVGDHGASRGVRERHEPPGVLVSGALQRHHSQERLNDQVMIRG